MTPISESVVSRTDLAHLDCLAFVLKYAIVAELIARLDVKKRRRAGTAHNRIGRSNQSRSTRIDWSGQECFEKWTARNVAGANHHRYLVLSSSAYGEFDFRNIRIVRITIRTQFT